MAGQSQSPRGILATTSTLPYLILFFPLVVSLALRTGGIDTPSVLLLRTAHEPASVLVHVPSLVRFNVYPFNNWSSVIEVVRVVKVGTMWRFPSLIKEFVGSDVVQSKEPVLYYVVLVSVFLALKRINFYCSPITANLYFMTPCRRIDISSFKLIFENQAVLNAKRKISFRFTRDSKIMIGGLTSWFTTCLDCSQIPTALIAMPITINVYTIILFHFVAFNCTEWVKKNL